MKSDIVTISTRLPRVTETTIIRALANDVITASATANVAGAYTFTLNSANVGVGFFDMYKIEAVRVNIRPQQNAIGLFTNSTNAVAPFYNVIDYDDASSLASAGDAESYSTCLALPVGQSCSRTFRPRMALAAYQGTFTGYANVASTWIDSSYPSVQHYGLKYFVPKVTTGQTQLQSWDISIEYFISLKKSI